MGYRKEEETMTKLEKLDPRERLESSRREAERRLADVRTALAREVRWLPKNRWIAPLVAFGCGVVLARGLASRRKV